MEPPALAFRRAALVVAPLLAAVLIVVLSYALWRMTWPTGREPGPAAAA